jgi:branched-chain amino acid transport system substrate-binding protein
VADQIADSDPQKKILIAYRDAYEKKYGQAVSKFGGNAHDAIRIIISALKSVGPNPEKIRDYIENLKDYVGIVGVYNYSPTDHNGLSKDYFVLVKVVNNNWKLLE